jgi:hypothetical protein
MTSWCMTWCLQLLLPRRRHDQLVHDQPDKHHPNLTSTTPSLFLLQVSDSFPFKWINKKWKEPAYQPRLQAGMSSCCGSDPRKRLSVQLIESSMQAANGRKPQ